MSKTIGSGKSITIAIGVCHVGIGFPMIQLAVGVEVLVAVEQPIAVRIEVCWLLPARLSGNCQGERGHRKNYEAPHRAARL
jgi:hypothetical protein